MKKSKFALIVALSFLLIIAASSAYAYTVDTRLASGGIPSDLHDSGNNTVIAWVNGYVNPDVNNIMPFSSLDFFLDSDGNYSLDPGITGWEYAVVKVGVGSKDPWLDFTLWQDTNDDDILTVSPDQYTSYGFRKISHADVFDGQPSVPEPSTMFLLGIGLVGLVGCTKKVKK